MLYRSFLLSGLLGVSTGLGISDVGMWTVREAIATGSNAQNGMVRSCSGKILDLGSPQLTEIELKNLGDCGGASIPQLLRAFRSQDWKVQVIAVHGMGLLGQKAKGNIAAVGDLLRDQNPDVRFAAAQALGEIGTAGVVPALQLALADDDENVRVSATVAFQQIGDAAKGAKPALFKALWDSNWYVRSRVAASLSRFPLEESDVVLLMEPGIHGFTPSGQELISLLTSIDPNIENNPLDAPFLFIKGLKNKDPKVRASSAIVIGKIIDALRPLRQEKSDKLDSVEILDSLLSTYSDKEPSVRKAVLDALFSLLQTRRGDIAYEKISPILISGIQDSSSEEVRRDSALILGKLYVSSRGKYNLVPILIDSLQDKSLIVRQEILQSLNLISANINGRISEKPPLYELKNIQVIKSLMRQVVTDSSAEIRSIAINNLDITTLVNVMEDNDRNSDLKRNVMSEIAIDKFIDSKEEVEKIHSYLKDSDSDIRINATIILDKAQKTDKKTVVEVFREGLRSKQRITQLNTLTAILRPCMRYMWFDKLKCSTFIPLTSDLINLLTHSDKSVKYLAALNILEISNLSRVSPKILKDAENILGDAISSESFFTIREHAIYSLIRRKSFSAFSNLSQSFYIDDYIERYVRDCDPNPYLDSTLSKLPLKEYLSIRLQGLKNSKVRFSGAHNFYQIAESPSDSQIISVIKNFSQTLEKQSHLEYQSILLSKIFQLKGQDFRRSLVYSLGRIGLEIDRSLNNDYGKPSIVERDILIQGRLTIVNDLQSILKNDNENQEIRWLAAASLQTLNANPGQLFEQDKSMIKLKENIRTKKDRQRGFMGLEFDVYSKQLIYIHTGCGGGLSSIYEALRDLLRVTKK